MPPRYFVMSFSLYMLINIISFEMKKICADVYRHIVMPSLAAFAIAIMLHSYTLPPPGAPFLNIIL